MVDKDQSDPTDALTPQQRKDMADAALGNFNTVAYIVRQQGVHPSERDGHIARITQTAIDQNRAQDERFDLVLNATAAGAMRSADAIRAQGDNLFQRLQIICANLPEDDMAGAVARQFTSRLDWLHRTRVEDAYRGVDNEHLDVSAGGIVSDAAGMLVRGEAPKGSEATLLAAISYAAQASSPTSIATGNVLAEYSKMTEQVFVGE